jgi:hypothetical protein
MSGDTAGILVIVALLALLTWGMLTYYNKHPRKPQPGEPTLGGIAAGLVGLIDLAAALARVLVPVALFLGVLYGLVRFVKWAWQG